MIEQKDTATETESGKPSRQTTIKDIAEILGVSYSTVSRALHDYSGISEDTKQKVKDLAKAMNYHPNAYARSLVLRQSRIIGVIVPDIENPYYTSFCKHLTTYLEKNTDYKVVICDSDREIEKEKGYIEYFQEHRVAGLIIVPSGIKEGYFIELLESGTPLVLVDFDGKQVGVDSVTYDNYSGTKEAIQYLVSLGYSKIAHVAGKVTSFASNERLRGFMASMRAYKVAKEDVHIVYAGPTFHDGIEAANKILEMDTLPDAVFVVNDMVAIGMIRHFYEQGIKIPEEMAVVGFDDIPMAKMLSTPLTTVHQSTQKLAETTGSMLKRQIREGRGGKSSNIKLKTKLIIRESCGEKLRIAR
jgi:LacI family transcriptional regulator